MSHLWKTTPSSPDPSSPGRSPAGLWKAAPRPARPAPSHSPWKTLRVSHRLPGHGGGFTERRAAQI